MGVDPGSLVPYPEPGVPRHASSFETVKVREHEGRKHVLLLSSPVADDRLAAAVRHDADGSLHVAEDESVVWHGLNQLDHDEREAAEQARWDALTSEQQAAERAEHKAWVARRRQWAEDQKAERAALRAKAEAEGA
jgi:hypothetical protein